MSMLNVTLPDGTIKEVAAGTTPHDVARSIGEGLARQTVAAYVDDTLVDASTPIEADIALRLVTLNTPEGLELYRHSTAHLMAHAVKELYGKKKFWPPHFSFSRNIQKTYLHNNFERSVTHNKF